MFQVAAGILIASGILAVMALGLSIALDRDNQALQSSGPGWWIAVAGFLAAIVVIYMAA